MDAPKGPWGSTKVCLLTNRVTLVTQLTSRELVLQEKRVFITKQPY